MRPVAADGIYDQDDGLELPTTWDVEGFRRRAERGRAQAVRPSLSAPLVCLAVAWPSVLAVDEALLDNMFGVATSDGSSIWVVVALVAAVSIASLFARGIRTVALLACGGLLFGCLAGANAQASVIGSASEMRGRPVSAYEYLVETDPARTKTGGWRFEASCLEDGERIGRVWVDAADTVVERCGIPSMGEILSASGTWKEIADDEFGRSLLKRGVGARARLSAFARAHWQAGPVGAIRAWRAGLLKSLEARSSDARALTAGVVAGMQAALGEFDVKEDFSELGLSHLVAVSGSHLAVVAGILGALLGRTPLRPAARASGRLAALMGYVVLTGLQGSAVRAFAMVACAEAGRAAGRRSHSVSSLGAAALVLLLAQPEYAATMGFSLSVLSVAGICVFGGLAREWAAWALPDRTPGFVVDALALTVVSQAATLPVTVPAFSTIPLIGPFANAVEAPLVSALMVVGMACAPVSLALAAAGASGVADAVLLPCDAIAGACCGMGSVLAGLPCACVTVDADAAALALASAGTALAIYAFWPAPTSRRVAACVGVPLLVATALWASWRFLAPARIVVLDVGQGDAILVQDGMHALLVDTGPDDAVLLALARNHVVHLDAVLLTHTDLDHAGGLDYLEGRIEIERVVVAQGVADHMRSAQQSLYEAAIAATRTGGATVGLDEVERGAQIVIGGYVLDVLAPADEVAGDENEDSVVVLARYESRRGSLTALLTGDAEVAQIGPLAAAGEIGDVDLYKAGHHGSKASIDDLVMKQTTPEVVVASAGAGNTYGHPSEECVSCAESNGATFFCTIDCGDVEVRPGVDGATVRTNR